MSDSNRKKSSTVIRAEFLDNSPSGLGSHATTVFLRGMHQKYNSDSSQGSDGNNNLTTESSKSDNKNNDFNDNGNINTLGSQDHLEDKESDENIIVTSPLMENTPSAISLSLVKLYPYLIIANHILGILTWSNKNIWSSVLMVLIYIITVSQLSFITKFFGHIIIVSLLMGYAKLNQFIEKMIYEQSTIEDIVQIMNQVSYKFDLLLYPLTNLDMDNIERLLLFMVLISPIVIIINLLIIPPKRCLLILGVFVLTYHSPGAKVTRRLFWKFKCIRKLIYYITGLNLGGIDVSNGYNSNGIYTSFGLNETLLANVQRQVNKKLSLTKNGSLEDEASNKEYKLNTYSAFNKSDYKGEDNKPIKFTYVLYENQRHWIGIGWKSTMLNYERTPWTDEFLNETSPPDKFQLPPMDNISGMKWRWLDKTWRLDLTNDGAIDIGNSTLKTTADPTPNQGYLYYDNYWKKPSTEESFTKYTRRRRWIRTAELIKVDCDDRQNEGKRQETDSRERNSTSSDGATILDSKGKPKWNSRMISGSNVYDSIEMKFNDAMNNSKDFMAHDSSNLLQLKRNNDK
ncbi:peroxisome biogenesis protein PWA37_002181 [Arxiozyma heterogenica]|uniref:peroxisome biogenesis protein n=1 Tax=Arxiozyma heterogenica TaxID=278026 RepID=UPI002F1E5B8E